MHYLRTFSRFLLGSSINSLLLLVPVLFALHALTASPAPIKHALQAGGVYDAAPGAFIDESVSSKDTDAQTKQFLENPDVRKIVNNAITPQFLQTNVDSALDNTYAWLNGKTATLQIKVDTTSTRERLIKDLTAYATHRAESLPACTLQQARALDPNQDILSIPCLPPGVSPSNAAAEFSQTITDATNQLDQQPDQTVNTSAGSEDARSAFQAFTHYFWIVPLLLIVLATAYVLFHHDRRSGIRRLGRMVLINGVTLGLLAIIFGLLFSHAVDLVHDSTVSNKALQTSLTKAVTILVDDFKRTLLLWALGYVLVGVATILLLRRYTPVKTTAGSGVTPLPPITS